MDTPYETIPDMSYHHPSNFGMATYSPEKKHWVLRTDGVVAYIYFNDVCKKHVLEIQEQISNAELRWCNEVFRTIKQRYGQ